MSLISVIVPVYKVEKYLVKCVDSILQQTNQNIEVILVDDGSPDSCSEICDQYALRDSRVKVIHKTNGGLSSARNAGLDVVKGDLIAFVDSDDWIAPDTYESMLANMKKNDSDVVICGTRCIYEDYEQVYYKIPPQKEVWISDEALKSFLTGEYFTPMACDKLYKRFLFDSLRFPEGKIHEDEFVMHEVYDKAERISFLRAEKYYYLQRNGSIMSTRNPKEILHSYEAFRERFEYIRSHKSALLPFAALSLLDGMISCQEMKEAFLKSKENVGLSAEDEKYIVAFDVYRNDYENLELRKLMKKLPLSCCRRVRFKAFLYFIHPSLCFLVARIWRRRNFVRKELND